MEAHDADASGYDALPPARFGPAELLQRVLTLAAVGTLTWAMIRRDPGAAPLRYDLLFLFVAIASFAVRFLSPRHLQRAQCALLIALHVFWRALHLTWPTTLVSVGLSAVLTVTVLMLPLDRRPVV